MKPDTVILLIKLVFAGAAVVAVVAFLLRPLWAHLKARPDVELFVPDITKLEGEELEIPEGAEGAGARPQRNDLIDQARADPRQTALLVQRWLKDRQ